MKVEQLAMSVERLRMVKNRSKCQVSINFKNYKLKILWKDLSEKADILLEIYNDTDINNNDILMKLYDQECQLYFKMRALLNYKNTENLNLDEIQNKFTVIEGIKMTEIRKDM